MKLARFFTAIFLVVFVASHSEAQDQVYVQVRESKIRTQPKIWAPSVASVSYGDALSTQSEDSGWAKVKSATGKSGYIPVSAITAKKVVLASNRNTASMASDPMDAILAGKGFDQEVERMYASQSSGNYNAVNQLEKIRISEGELRSFVSSGSLRGGE